MPFMKDGYTNIFEKKEKEINGITLLLWMVIKKDKKKTQMPL